MASHCTLSLTLKLTFILIFITIHPSSSLTPASTSEVDTLLTFKSTINDPMNHLSSWSKTTTTHYCNWTGVICTTTTTSTISSLTLQNLNLSGEISPSICQLNNLVTLNLADNFFNQPIPLHISQCESLNTLNLSSNLIWGTIPDQISEFKSLKFLDFSKNHIEGKIPDGVGSLVNLEQLNLGNNLLSGNVPNVFGNLTNLVVLDLSLNPFMESEISSDIGKLMKLEKLLLQRSGFYGEIPSSISGLKSLTFVDFSQNNLTGVLPTRFGKKLVSFDVSQNNLFGFFPNGICESNELISVSLHTNFFNGTLVNTSVANCLNLERLEIQNNRFHGDFPNNLWSLPKIKVIRAENNRFSGEIPDSISIASQLEQVQIDNNSFISKIPHGLGLVKSLYRFSASLNGLYGELPPNFCNSPVMSIINFSHNYIGGEIPELKECKKLVSLSLADNNFVGKIPESLGDLPVLTYLDLSHNNLTGEIPLELQNLKLALFNVSFNRLSGQVPSSLISGLPALYIQGNPELCGPGLSSSCPNNSNSSRKIGISKLTCALISLALIAGILSLALGFFIVRRSSIQKSETGNWKSVFFYPLRVTEHDLIIAMDEKASRGSYGAFGRVYVVNLPSNELIAVKKMPTLRNQSFRNLKTEVKTMAKIRHKNIARILGFCHSDDSIFLIYECMEKGSLGDMINTGNFQLAWSFRLNIAIGIAQGLAYLHKDYVPHLLHRDVKSRNVLLDTELEPKLTDFSLDRIVGENAFQSSMASKSSCYMAPEFGYNKKATEQMDTYGFGVILLELVTGRAAEPMESSEESVDIVKWVRRKVNISNGSVQVLDPKISSSCQQEGLGMLEIALQCTSVMPEKRPSMYEVVAALQSLGSKTHFPSLNLAV